MTGGKAPRAAGDRFERNTADKLRAAGYLVVRSAGSHGPADLVAMRADRLPALIQCKITDNTTTRQRTAFYRTAEDAGCTAILACRPGRIGVAFVRITPGGYRVSWPI